MSKMELDPPSPPPLFAQNKFAIVRSRALTDEVADKLSHAIKSHGGDVLLDDLDYNQGQNLPLKELNYIVASLVDFRDYAAACETFIPVVKPDWIYTSVSRNKLANSRQHNPDPRLFLSGIVVCCADLPEGDKDAIVGGVLAMGGTHSHKVTVMVTHIVALTMDSEKCQVVESKRLNIKIVLPHWFDDCLKLGRRIDERPYLLPDPEILRNNAPKAPMGTQNKDLAGIYTPDSMLSNAEAIVTSPRADCNLFKQKGVLLSSDLGIGPHMRHSLEQVILSSGGSIVQRVQQADMYVGRYRDGNDYIRASRAGKEVGNLAWLFHMITNNAWVSPLKRLLHYPEARDGLPGFKDFRISLSNYSGEARVYLERLIIATGAECTKTLKQDNTHLVTAHNISEKCQAAQDWGIHLVNHLWLEESYAKWKLQSVSNSRYTHFPARTNLGEVVGQTSINRKVIEDRFLPEVEDVEMSDAGCDAKPMPAKSHIQAKAINKNDAPNKPDEADAKVLNPKVKDVRKLGNIEKPKAPMTPKYVAPGKENATPQTSGSRKSKEAAVAKLHDYAPDMALYEKEKKRTGGVVYGGRRKGHEDGGGHSRKRSLDAGENTDSTVDGPMRKSKKIKNSSPIHLLISGFSKWVGQTRVEDEDKKRLRSLGIVITQDPSRASHLAAPHILRTKKFVTALAYGPVVVSTEFIEECLAQEELLDPEDFIMTDKATEKKLRLNLKESLERAKKHRNQLLQGRTFYCVENIHGGYETYQAIIEANGGKCLSYRGRPGTMMTSRRAGSNTSMVDEDAEAEVFLISGTEPEQERLWSKFRHMVEKSRKVPKIIQTDWVLETAMSQEIKPITGFQLH